MATYTARTERSVFGRRSTSSILCLNAASGCVERVRVRGNAQVGCGEATMLVAGRRRRAGQPGSRDEPCGRRALQRARRLEPFGERHGGRAEAVVDVRL